MNRRNIGLSILLAAQLVLVLVIYWPREAGRVSEITLLDVEQGKVASLVISDDYGSSITLERKGDAWIIDPPENYPADAERVRSTLRKLSHLVSKRLVSSSRGSHGRLRVSDEKFNRKLKLIDSDGKEHVIYLGTAQGKGVYAREGKSDDVVFIDNLSSWEFATSPRSWWKTTVVDVDPGALKGVEIHNANWAFVLSRDMDGNWTDEAGTALDQDKVKKLLRQIKNIRLSEYLKRDTDKKLEKVEASLKLVPAKGRAITVEIGSEDNSERLVRASTEGHLLKVRSSELRHVLDAKPADFKLGKRPEPAKSVENNKGQTTEVKPEDQPGRMEAVQGVVSGDAGAGEPAREK